MIRAVIFDCFGVLYVGSLTVLADRCNRAIDAKQVHDLSHAVDHGFISEDEFAQQIAPLVDMDQDEVRNMMSEPQKRYQGMFAYAKELKSRGIKTAVLSNFGRDAIDRLFSDEERQNTFDIIVASGDIGVTKPYPSAYTYMLEQLQVTPDEAIMIDDVIANVDGAIEVGMRGIVFTGIEPCKRKVEELLNHA